MNKTNELFFSTQDLKIIQSVVTKLTSERELKDTPSVCQILEVYLKAREIDSYKLNSLENENAAITKEFIFKCEYIFQVGMTELDLFIDISENKIESLQNILKRVENN